MNHDHSKEPETTILSNAEIDEIERLNKIGYLSLNANVDALCHTVRAKSNAVVSAIKELKEIRACDKCDLCEDHHE